MFKRIFLISTTCYLFFLAGCATSTYVSPRLPLDMPGVYHRVERKETLWKLSRMYNIDIDEIIRVNHISDATNIEVGQLIFIPNYQKPKLPVKAYYSEDFIWPLKGKVISTFGQLFKNMVNKGINIQPHSVLDVLASRSGKVVFYADDFRGFGKTIIIEHGDGFSTVYARNSQVYVKPGDSVQKGAIIAKAGSAGRDKDIYLHFEIRKGYVSQNPYFYLPR